MDTIRHKIIPSEIKYGIIVLRKSDGTEEFFRSLPNTFNVVLRNSKLLNRRALGNNVWIGYGPMMKFNPGEVVTISRNSDTVFIN